MDELLQAVRAALQSNDAIAREQVRAWMHAADDAEVEALLYDLTRVARERIEPRLDSEETCALIQRYLLRCIREDPQDGNALPRYEAAGELEAWVDHLASMRNARKRLKSVADAVTDLFLNGDDKMRRAVETGFLEHVLEQKALRPLFSHWAADDRLRDAWALALAWGEAHPNWMKGLREGLRAAQNDQE